MTTNDLPLLFPEKIQRHEDCRPPKEAYFFIPSEDDKILFDNIDPKLTRRKIFEIKEDYLDFEKFKLDLLKEEIQNIISKGEEELKEISEWKDGDLLRFHQSTSYTIPNTIKLLKEHLEWKKSRIFPLDLNESVSNIINSGFIYEHGRDNHFRPIIVVRAQTFLKIKDVYEFEDIVTAIVYFIEYIISYMLIPGQVENWNIIIDLYNVSIFSMPDTLMKIFRILQSNYRARLNSLFIIGMSPWLNAIWTVIKSFIDSNTNKKIKFIKENAKYEIFELINSEQVEIKYGGLAKNLDSSSNGYFPPIMPSNNYLKQNDVKEELLINEDQYIEALSMGIISQVSPYMSEKIKKRESFISVSRYDGKFKLNLNFLSLASSIYEDARSKLDTRMSPIIPKGRHSLDLRYSKTNSFIKYINNANHQKNKDKDLPILPDLTLRSLIHKRNSTLNQKINTMPRMSYDSVSLNEHRKSYLSNLNSSSCLSNKSRNGQEEMVEIEVEIESDHKTVKGFQNLSQLGSGKRKERDEITNGTTKDTKENRLDINNINNNINNASYDIVNNSNYNTNLYEENDKNKINSNLMLSNISKISLGNNKVKSNGKLKVSEFDANISDNEDSNKHNQKLTFSASFQFNNQQESVPRVKNNPYVDENRNNISNPEPEYISLETTVKNNCCSSKNSKCLIY